MTKQNLFIGPLIRVISGFIVSIGVVLAHYHSAYWLCMVLFVSLNFVLSGFTGYCMMEEILLYLGFSSEMQALTQKDRHLKDAGIKRHQMPQVSAFFVKLTPAAVGIVCRVGVGPTQIGPSAVNGLAVAHAAAGSIG